MTRLAVIAADSLMTPVQHPAAPVPRHAPGVDSLLLSGSLPVATTHLTIKPVTTRYPLPGPMVSAPYPTTRARSPAVSPEFR